MISGMTWSTVSWTSQVRVARSCVTPATSSFRSTSPPILAGPGLRRASCRAHAGSGAKARHPGGRGAAERYHRDNGPVIDLHAHVLPGVDDGPRTTDESLALLAASAERGVKTIVATPHVSQHYAGTRSAGVARAVDELNRTAATAGLAIEVVPGAEIELLHVDALPAEEVRALRLGSGGYALVECPFTATTAMAERLLWSAHRLWPLVLAHPERCRAFHGEDGLALLERLVARGAAVQVTAAALTGGFGPTVQRAALDMVEHGLVHLVASDTHDVEHRGPELREHLDAAGLDDLVPLLCEQGPREVLAGRPPDPAPPRPSTTARTAASWWRRLTARRY